MNLTFRQIQVFTSVARHLSFTQAAKDLHLSQPAVSMQVKQMEDQVGLPLFEQIGKQIYLTEAGHEIFHYSRAIQQLLTEAEEVVDELKGAPVGVLSFVEDGDGICASDPVDLHVQCHCQLCGNRHDPPNGEAGVVVVVLQAIAVLVHTRCSVMDGKRDQPAGVQLHGPKWLL